MEEPVIAGGSTGAAMPVSPENEPALMDDINIDSFGIPEVPDLEIPDLEMPDLELSDLELSDIGLSEEAPEIIAAEADGILPAGPRGLLDDLQIGDLDLSGDDLQIDDLEQEGSGLSDNDLQIGDLEPTEPGLLDDDLRIEDLGLAEPGLSDDDLQIGDLELSEPGLLDDDLQIGDLELPDPGLLDDDLQIGDLGFAQSGLLNHDLQMADLELAAAEPSGGGLQIEDLELSEPGLSDSGLPNANLQVDDLEPVESEPVVTELEFGNLEPFEAEQPGSQGLDISETNIENFGTDNMDLAKTADTGEELSLEDMGMPASDDELKLEDIELPDEEPFLGSELSIDGLDQAIQSETELQMAGELNIDEFGFDNLDMGMSDSMLSDDIEGEKDASVSMDDNLEDVLNMLDDDAELAEINDMLKKSDNNEPIQDDVMDLLHQMADDEAASVNAGIKHMDDDDDGVPLPEIPQPVVETSVENTKKKEKKSASKKKKGDSADAADADVEHTKEPGKLSKFFNMLTEEIVPEPTEEELAAEKEAKAAKKQENLTKKEEEKLTKAEEKKAKAEEKAAANRVKQEAAAQKKKEKLAKKEAKKAKLAAEGPKKRIPPKKIAVAVAFGASVGGAVVLATNVLSAQGFLQTARNAYYDGDYKTVYEATYGMELDDSESDGLIKARSEVIFKVQRRYDSYQTNIKMGREVEALDALLCGISAYDAVNADAEKYGVMAEVDAVKATILDTLESKYGLDESKARAIINSEDALAYTIALNEVIAGN